MKDWHIGLILVIVIVAVVGLLMVSPGMWNIMGRADISEVMQPYEMLFTNVESLCEGGGGTWHDEPNWWGCEGVGPAAADCSNEVASVIEQQCEGMGATWVCNSGDVYCKY